MRRLGLSAPSFSAPVSAFYPLFAHRDAARSHIGSAGLPTLHEPASSIIVPIFSELFGICARGTRAPRSSQG
jgi:hypothetical protein